MRRAQRRARRIRAFLAFAFLALALLAVVFTSTGKPSLSSAAKFMTEMYRPVARTASAVFKGVAGLFGGSRSDRSPKKSAQRASPEKKAGSDRRTLLIVGIDESTGKRQAKGFSIVRLDIGKRRIDGITIPGNTFASVPGQGQEELQIAYGADRDAFLAAVRDIIPVKADGLVEMRYADYERLTFNSEFEGPLRDARAVNIDSARVADFAEEASRVEKDDINLIPLPVKTIAVEGDVFYEPDDAEIARLLRLVWGVRKVAVKKPRVVVLNGNGVPGVGAKAAKLLAAAGFEVVETKNADNFKYPQTKILIYGDGKEAEKIKKTIGTGLLIEQRLDAGVADYAVILGADYR